jgi:serine/threonine-protein kinase RsbW
MALALAEEDTAVTSGTSQHMHATGGSGPSFFGIHRSPSLLELEAWMPSEIKAISPTVDQLMQAMALWRCAEGNEFAVDLALREALSNAIIHGNRMDPNKRVEVHCQCQRGEGVWLIVKDQGKGFDPAAVPDPLASERLLAEHGRGIQLMKVMMDEVWFECGGTEVHMSKAVAPRTGKEKQHALQHG